MNLLFFISSLSYGGAERVTASLANHWAVEGWQISIVTVEGESKDFYELHPTISRFALNLAGESRNPLLAMCKNLHRVVALRRLLRQIRPNVALALMDSSNVQLALASYGLRDLVTIGSERIHPPQFPLGGIWKILRRYCYGRLNAVVALTAESADWLRCCTRVQKVVVIPNVASYPLPANPPHMPPPSKANGAHLLLAVGRLCEQKGFDTLIAAFQSLAAKFPLWRLIILGDGPLYGDLAEQIADAGLDGRILLHCRVGNLVDWYAAADLYVMTSRFEGFPNTLAEAMAHGLPVVSFDCDTGPRDIIRHEVDGLLVPNGDGATLVSALGRLMADESLREQFSSRAVEVRERFSMERITLLWKALFEEFLHEK